MENADLGASKTIRDRAIQLIDYKKVHGDSVEPESKDSKRPKQRKEKSLHPRGKRGEPGNPTYKAKPETGIQDNIA